MVKVYLCCFTQFTVDQSKLTVNGSVLSDPPNVRYLAALYLETDMSGGLISFKDTRITSIISVSIARHLQQYDCTGFIFCKFC